MSMPKKLSLLLAFLALMGASLSASSAIAGGEREWEFIDGDDGIHVWKREIAGQDMPGFRGQTHIEASIETIITVMLDHKRHTEWMYACEESAVLKRFSADHAIMYNRIGAPWPVWDRDVIADTLIERSSDGKQLKVTFQNVASDLRKVPNKVIRLPKLQGFYKLWAVAPNRTKILYQVEADLGGSIPRWLAISGAKDLPHITLERLRERVEHGVHK
jgi:hypothetical protein